MAAPRVRFEFVATPSFRDVAGRFQRLTEGVTHEKREAARRLGRKYVAYAREEAPKGETGKFAKSIGYRSFSDGDAVGFRTIMANPLGTWIHEGTRAHPIPKSRLPYPLRFFWAKGPSGPGVYFFWSVNHPGTKPNPFLKRAQDRFDVDARLDMNRIAVNLQRGVTQ